MGLFDLFKRRAKGATETDDDSVELRLAELNGKWGYIDKAGKKVIPCKYDKAYEFSDGLALVKLNHKWGYIDKTGTEVIPCKYDDAYSFIDGLARVKLSGKCGAIDKTGKEIIPIKYDQLSLFREGLAAVKLNNKYGVIDKTGTEVIPLKYDYADDFCERLAMMKLNGKWRNIDKQGNSEETTNADIVNHLVRMYKSSPRGEGFSFYSQEAEPLKQMGKILNTAGGFDLMLFVHQQFAATYTVMGAARNLEQMWDGIGLWRG